MACTPMHPGYSPTAALCTGGTASCNPVCRRFGILTHHLPPIEEALRGAGLELEWSGAVHGGKSSPSARGRHVWCRCAGGRLQTSGAAARCRWRMAAANPSCMCGGNLPTQAR